MIEQTDREPRTEGRCEEPHVWVCAFEWRDGVDVWVGRTENLAPQGLASMCRLFWDEARGHVDRLIRDDGPKPFSPVPPDDDRVAIALYFDVMNEASPPESYVTRSHAVVGGFGDGGIR